MVVNKKRIYSIWKNMKYRCGDSQRTHYGKKGIGVCNQWKKFEAFYLWSIETGYDDSKTIDRKDNSKGYSPSNCRWADNEQQAWNKSDTRIFELNGRNFTGIELQKKFGVPAEIIRQRINLGWSVSDAVGKPYQPRRRLRFRGESVTIAELSQRIGMNYEKLKYRITRGWPIEKAIRG